MYCACSVVFLIKKKLLHSSRPQRNVNGREGEVCLALRGVTNNDGGSEFGTSGDLRKRYVIIIGDQYLRYDCVTRGGTESKNVFLRYVICEHSHRRFK